MKACLLLALLLGATAAQNRGQSRCANLSAVFHLPAGCQDCFFTYRSSGNSCPVGCVMDFNNTCGGGGGGGATRYGCKDSPADACSGKHSDEKSCNADSGCSWCVSTVEDGHSCPGGTLQACIKACPSTPLPVYQECVAGCRMACGVRAVSSCVPLANVSGWVKGNACWNTTCTKVPQDL